ncbi:MAG: DUF333 domain-containing protein [Pseudomonadota bacterium]
MKLRGLISVCVFAPLTHGSLAHASSSETSQSLIANPAATFCEEEGGTYRIVSEETGERGVCVLPDGEEVDAWEFFRAENEAETQN